MFTAIIGLDAFDPQKFERLYNQGRLPNLGRLADEAGYATLRVSDPPQSEISWTSIATGLNPGGHGIFDFVHRDPLSYTLVPSLLPTKRTALGINFVSPYNARTIFEQATHDGYPATAFWWPATFPARLDLPVHNIPGLGTPDIQGRLGLGSAFSADLPAHNPKHKTPVEQLRKQGNGRYSGVLLGPRLKGGNAELPFQLDILDEHRACMSIGKQSITLSLGVWSPILEVSFKVGFLSSVKAITRIILKQAGATPSLYFLPLQIHPLASPWPYATPPGFVKETWNTSPFLTLGWPQDTTALEEGWIRDDQFLTLCEEIETTREKIFTYHLRKTREGLFAGVFDSLDRIQHMFWRDHPEIIDAWYERLDGLVGRIERILPPRARLLVISDHGFNRFEYKVHLNTWLEANGYLKYKPGNNDPSITNVDWSQTRAYAIGLNSLYLNIAGREGQGMLNPAERDTLSSEIQSQLLALRGPDGQAVVQQAPTQAEAFEGPLSAYGPDLLIGYAPGYRASSETGTGGWAASIFETNQDHWGADHCISAAAVPGVLFSSQGLQSLSNPSYQDIPALAIGKAVDQPGNPSPPPTAASGEDQKTIEERLKSLGYL